MMASLSARLLIAVSVLLLVFFGTTIFLLDLAFRTAAERAIRDRLDVHIIVLLAEAEPDQAGSLEVPDTLPEARFLTPGSGLYGQIATPAGERIWRSPSSVGDGLPLPAALAPGETRFQRAVTNDGQPVFALSLGIAWEFDETSTGQFVFTAAESLTPYYEQVGRFRGQLFWWFALLTVVLLATQLLLLRWMLRPLRRVEREIAAIEEGMRAELGRGYPRELRGVTENLNAFIRGERERQARYRDSLGNLAHALKTPLAVMRNALEVERSGSQTVHTLSAQVDRMQDIVSYQLQRARAWGSATLGGRPVEVATVVEQVAESLQKVYAEKAPQCSLDLADGARFYGDRGDLMEVVGNLMDNAFKWCKRRVEVAARVVVVPGTRRNGLTLRFDDDGQGIDPRHAARIVERGVRADEQVDGHGLGLAVVREIVALHGGRLDIGRSPLGGARIEASFPPR